MHFPITNLSSSLDHGSDARVVVILSNTFPSFPLDLCLLKCALRNCRWIILCVPVEAGIRGLSRNLRCEDRCNFSSCAFNQDDCRALTFLCLKTCWSRLGLWAQKRYRRAKQTQDCSLSMFNQQQYLSSLHGHLGRVPIHMPVHLCAEQSDDCHTTHFCPMHPIIMQCHLPSACISPCMKSLHTARPSPPQFISFLCK